MKKFVFVLAILVIMGLLAVYFINYPTGEWQTYANSRYEFQIDFPSDWTLGEAETNNAGRELYSPDEEVYCYAYGFENALQNEQGNPQSLDEFIDWLVVDWRVIEREPDMLGDKPAVRLLFYEGKNIKKAKYALGDDVGVGVFCKFDSLSHRDKYESITNIMMDSMGTDVDLGGESQANIASCSDLLSGVLTPLKDRQIFYDDKYTEVTMTSKDAWDRNRLPSRVIELESKGYDCFPMPSEFSGGEAEGDVLPQPEVTMVEWSCELEYEEWEYLQGLETMQPPDSFRDYNCAKQDCWMDDAGESYVWLCTK
ncbi:hypothetical protein KKF55_06110 [Patescibacteria group bacterium]|nr:hypothetical protein [Patescibacteria group bacterium]